MAAAHPGKTVLVTGTSSGIGAATAARLVKGGYEVFGTVRKQADADRLKANLGAGFHPLLMDITQQGQIEAAAEAVIQKLGGRALAGLVNNAGISLFGPILDIPLDELREHLNVNLVGHVAVTRAFIPLLLRKDTRDQTQGRIVIITSVSGECAFPFAGAYAISKHGLEAFSDVLRRELLPLGVPVSMIAPSSVNTPIWDKVAAVDLGQYRNSPIYSWLTRAVPAMVDQGRHGLTPSIVADTVALALDSLHPKARYRISQRPMMAAALRRLPSNLLDRFLIKAYATPLK